MNNIQKYYITNIKLFKKIASKILFNSEDVEDVLQNLYISIYNVNKVDNNDYKKYLIMATKNQCLKILVKNEKFKYIQLEQYATDTKLL